MRLIHEQERAEAALMLEWMILPQIAVAVAAARELSAAEQTMARASSEAGPFLAVAGHFNHAARRHPDLRGAALA